MADEILEKLNVFYDSIKDYPKLQLKEAKVLYKEYLSTKDNALRDKIICGFLYKVHEYLVNHDFVLLKSSSYDMDDIIDSFIEIMIRRIDDGILLKANSFGYIFNIDFHNDLFEVLTSKRIAIYDVLGIDVDIFTQLFGTYCELKMKNPNAKLEDIFSLSLVPYFIGQFKNIPYMEIIFASMIETMIKSDADYLDLTSDKIKRFAQIMLKNALASKLVDIDKVYYSDLEDALVKKVYEEQIMQIVLNNCKLNEKEKSLIIKYYREGYSIDEIAKSLNISFNQARGCWAQSLVKLRKSYTLKKQAKSFFGR